jgi:hypothetical protein
MVVMVVMVKHGLIMLLMLVVVGGPRAHMVVMTIVGVVLVEVEIVLHWLVKVEMLLNILVAVEVRHGKVMPVFGVEMAVLEYVL